MLESLRAVSEKSKVFHGVCALCPVARKGKNAIDPGIFASMDSRILYLTYVEIVRWICNRG